MMVDEKWERWFFLENGREKLFLEKDEEK